MTKYISIITILFFVMLHPLQAQDIDDKGFFIGASLLGTSFQLDIPGLEDETDTGGGLALKGGYNFNTNLALYLSLDGSSMSQDEEDNYSFVHFDLGVEGRLGDYESSFRPFGRLSLLGAAATIDTGDGDAEISGTGFGAGIGVHYFVNSNFALEVGYTHSWININEVSFGGFSVEIDENGRSGRLGVGFTYHF